MAISDLSAERLNAIDSRTREIGLGTVIQTAQNDIDTAEAAIDAIEAVQTVAASSLGLLYHIKVSTAGGATANTDTALPTGTWEFVDAHVINRGTGTTSDTITILKDSSAITDAIDISGADNTVARPSTVDDANISLVGGTNVLRVTETDGGSDDSPIVDVHVTLRKIA